MYYKNYVSTTKFEIFARNIFSKLFLHIDNLKSKEFNVDILYVKEVTILGYKLRYNVREM